MMMTTAILSICASFLFAGEALAQGAKVTSPIELAREAQGLKPGEWVWAPQISP